MFHIEHHYAKGLVYVFNPFLNQARSMLIIRWKWNHQFSYSWNSFKTTTIWMLCDYRNWIRHSLRVLCSFVIHIREPHLIQVTSPATRWHYHNRKLAAWELIRNSVSYKRFLMLPQRLHKIRKKLFFRFEHNKRLLNIE